MIEQFSEQVFPSSRGDVRCYSFRSDGIDRSFVFPDQSGFQYRGPEQMGHPSSRHVIHVVSLPYSGSSLLGLLLDSFVHMISLGEAVHLAAPLREVDCAACRCRIQECALYNYLLQSSRIRRGGDLGFYTEALNYYRFFDSRVTTLVDTSKSLHNSYLFHDRDQLRHRVVVLSKSPHEWAFSRIHHEGGSVAEAFALYSKFYETEITSTLDHSLDWCRVTYDSLVPNYAWTIEAIAAMAPVGTAFTAPHPFHRRPEWWASRSHIIGGNWAVASQMIGGDFQEHISEMSPHHQAKYRTLEHKLRRDDAWKQDPDFRRQCADQYPLHYAQLTPILAMLGQPSIEELIADVAP